MVNSILIFALGAMVGGMIGVLALALVAMSGLGDAETSRAVRPPQETRSRWSPPLPQTGSALLPPLAPGLSGGLFELEELQMQTGIGSAFGLILMSMIRQGWSKQQIIAMMTASIEEKFEEAKRVVDRMEKVASP